VAVPASAVVLAGDWRLHQPTVSAAAATVSAPGAAKPSDEPFVSR